MACWGLVQVGGDAVVAVQVVAAGAVDPDPLVLDISSLSLLPLLLLLLLLLLSSRSSIVGISVTVHEGGANRRVPCQQYGRCGRGAGCVASCLSDVSCEYLHAVHRNLAAQRHPLGELGHRAGP